MNCDCNNSSSLHDEAGVKTLKALYTTKGIGGVSFTEKLTNNLDVVALGAGFGLLGAFAFNKLTGSKRNKKR